MPWRETSPMEERIRFVYCYGISRKTGYKWLRRFEAEGSGGLADRSRAPRRCAHRMAEPVREALLEARRRHPT